MRARGGGLRKWVKIDFAHVFFYRISFFFLGRFRFPFLRHNSPTFNTLKMFANSNFNSAYTQQPMPCAHLPVSSDFTYSTHYVDVTYSRYGTHQPQYTFYPEQNDYANEQEEDHFNDATTFENTYPYPADDADADALLDPPNDMLLQHYDSTNDLSVLENDLNLFFAELPETALPTTTEVEEEEHILLTPAYFDQLEDHFSFDEVQDLLNSISNNSFSNNSFSNNSFPNNSYSNNSYSHLTPILAAH